MKYALKVWTFTIETFVCAIEKVSTKYYIMKTYIIFNGKTLPIIQMELLMTFIVFLCTIIERLS